ncbi:hypothetical protein AKO1_001353 [Acrasis kona]|uniref:Uncharacterized protein n=1 Tax=Acrasis kona TaxID=1008807 RepID=A0AAW2ZC34_9EUKA
MFTSNSELSDVYLAPPMLQRNKSKSLACSRGNRFIDFPFPEERNLIDNAVEVTLLIIKVELENKKTRKVACRVFTDGQLWCTTGLSPRDLRLQYTCPEMFMSVDTWKSCPVLIEVYADSNHRNILGSVQFVLGTKCHNQDGREVKLFEDLYDHEGNHIGVIKFSISVK